MAQPSTPAMIALLATLGINGAGSTTEMTRSHVHFRRNGQIAEPRRDADQLARRHRRQIAKESRRRNRV